MKFKRNKKNASPKNDIPFKRIMNKIEKKEKYKKEPPQKKNVQNKIKKLQFSSGFLESLSKSGDMDYINFLIHCLVKEVELSPRLIAQREKLRFDLEVLLNQDFNGASTFLFGSSASSLGFCNSDVDIVADLGVNPWMEKPTQGEAKEEAAKIVYRLSRLLKQRRFGYNVIPIPRARVPIVKFRCYDTDVDLSFRSAMPVYNTNLIKFYTKCHACVRPYMMLLRFWASKKNICGGGDPFQLLSNYTLAMMMLFALMQHKPLPVVPPVGLLRMAYRNNLKNDQNIGVVEGWDCAFTTDPSPWQHINHNSSIIELVHFFFNYYATLQMDQFAISPLSGVLIDKVDLECGKQKNLTPPFMEDYFKYNLKMNLGKKGSNLLVVQDPFEINRNICALYKERVVRFKRECKNAAAITEKVIKGEIPLWELLMNDEPDLIVSTSNSSESEEEIYVAEIDEKKSIECVDLSESKDDICEVEKETDVKICDEFILIDTKPSQSIIEDICGISDKIDNIETKSTELDVKNDKDLLTVKDLNTIQPQNDLDKLIFVFNLKIERLFNILSDGTLAFIDPPGTEIDKLKCVNGFWVFVLRNILCCKVTTKNPSFLEEGVEISEISQKEKDEISPKRFKASNGEVLVIEMADNKNDSDNDIVEVTRVNNVVSHVCKLKSISYPWKNSQWHALQKESWSVVQTALEFSNLNSTSSKQKQKLPKFEFKSMLSKENSNYCIKLESKNVLGKDKLKIMFNFVEHAKKLVNILANGVGKCEHENTEVEKNLEAEKCTDEKNVENEKSTENEKNLEAEKNIKNDKTLKIDLEAEKNLENERNSEIENLVEKILQNTKKEKKSKKEKKLETKKKSETQQNLEIEKSTDKKIKNTQKEKKVKKSKVDTDKIIINGEENINKDLNGEILDEEINYGSLF